VLTRDWGKPSIEAKVLMALRSPTRAERHRPAVDMPLEDSGTAGEPLLKLPFLYDMATTSSPLFE
jgi:hypothetical protein